MIVEDWAEVKFLKYPVFINVNVVQLYNKPKQRARENHFPITPSIHTKRGNTLQAMDIVQR